MPTLGTSLKVNYKGTYSSSITYNTNDIVYYNGTSYIALTTSTGQTPAAGTYWGLLANQGSTGTAGVTPSISATAAGLAAGASPTVTTTGTTAAPIFNFGLPAGAAGAAGTAGTAGGLTPVAKTAAYTAVSGDLVLASASGGAFSVTLPASPTTATVVGVVKTDATSAVVTVGSSAGIDISGLTTFSIIGLGQYAEFVWDGSLWHTVRSSVAARVLPTAPFIVNRWYSNLGNTTTSTSSSVGAVTFYVPYFLSRAVTVGSMGLNVNTAVAGANMRLGAYVMDPVSGLPTTVLSDFGSVSVAASGPISTTGTTAVWPAGWIFLATCGASTAGNVYTAPNPIYSAAATTINTTVYGGYTSSNNSFVANPTTAPVSIAPAIYFKITS